MTKNELLKKYYELNEKIKEYKKQQDELKETIKQLGSFSSKNYVCIVTTSIRNSLDTDLAKQLMANAGIEAPTKSSEVTTVNVKPKDM